MSEEMVFVVEGATALPADSISLSEAGLRERDHLQEWVLANPAILGPGVLIVTSEFDRWLSKSGIERDRLDVLGLDQTGRLVVAELKRDAAPDTVELQAIKYAAMASRFDLDLLADAHAAFVTKTLGESCSAQEAADRLALHTEDRVSPETLRAPRIVLIAGSFPANVTATTVWLTEMGLDITLVRIQAYRTSTNVVVTASQLYPPPDVEEFTVAPTRASRKARTEDELMETEWATDDIATLAGVLDNSTARAAIQLCADKPGEWIPFDQVIAATGRTLPQARADMGALTRTIKRHVGPKHWLIEAASNVGDRRQVHFRMTDERSRMWNNAIAQATAPTGKGATSESGGLG